ncbi:hypothetical protein G7054_g7000 [Neopestalotiopsis clavispora]|nr:hypothetical protein G7054_g7000 [Neopestalotiopsis clavispora]
MAPKVPPSGVWTPAVTLFDPDTDTLLPEDQTKYYKYLSTTGLAGLVVLGSNGETFLLTREERAQLLQIARQAVGPDFPIMAGVSGHSTKQALEFIADAAAAGADYGLLLPPAYFGKATTQSVIEGFYDEVASKSQLPLVIYNFPAVCNGVDLDSDTVTRLAQRHPGKIVGVKLTCGSVAKISRLSAVLKPDTFAPLAARAISSSAASPAQRRLHLCLWQPGDLKGAQALQEKQALSEQAIKAGIAVTKYAASVYTAPKAGIQDAEKKFRPRRPYEEPTPAVKEKLQKTMAEVASYDSQLA